MAMIEASEELQRAARLLGRRGGITTAQRLSAEQRRASAQHAVAIRWARIRVEQTTDNGRGTTAERAAELTSKRFDAFGRVLQARFRRDTLPDFVGQERREQLERDLNAALAEYERLELNSGERNKC
jgi:hypothetical protein